MPSTETVTDDPNRANHAGAVEVPPVLVVVVVVDDEAAGVVGDEHARARTNAETEKPM